MSDEKQVVTEIEVYEHLGIDVPDDVIKHNVQRYIRTADAYLKGSIGKDYPVDDSRAKDLALIIISDLYDNRGMQSTITGNTHKLVDDMSEQLRCELRGVSDEQSV